MHRPFNRNRWYFISFVVLTGFIMVACSKSPATGPVDVRWDREVCERCSMAVSDQYFAAQVRKAGNDENPSVVYKFDDIGCAVIWLQNKKWKDMPSTEIWVADHRNASWIDARKSWYLKDRNSPMGFGLGAQAEKMEHSINYTQAIEHIMMIEQRDHVHGGHHHHHM